MSEQNTPVGVWKTRMQPRFHQKVAFGYVFTISNFNRFSIRYWKAPWHQCICQRLFGWHLILTKYKRPPSTIPDFKFTPPAPESKHP